MLWSLAGIEMLVRARNAFIIWAKRRAPERVRIHTRGQEFILSRFEFFYPDERTVGGVRRNLPWWLPFNALLHCWDPKDTGEEFHNHRRWSITIVLRGKIIERSPNGPPKYLVPGSIVFRTTKVFHAFSVPKGYSGKTWTLFICGRIRRELKRTHFRRVPN